jgi:hypothetical protein
MDDAGWELWFGGELVRLVPHRARMQILILQAFEDANWAPFIPDPLPRDPERYKQKPAQRLRDVVRELNESPFGRVLRFHCNGNGQTIRWKLAEMELLQAGV